MDRLPALSLCVLTVAIAACDSDVAATAPPPSRVNAVAATRPKKVDPREFCDSWSAPGKARSFTLPLLAGQDVPPPVSRKKKRHSVTTPGPALAASQAWHWVNVWATWCEPCVEEMPMLLGWHERLRKEGVSLDMVFLSVDEDEQAVADFRKKHPTIPTGPRAANEEALAAWLETIELDATTAIPIHVFVDEAGKRRCVRTGSLLDYHYDVIAEIFRAD